MYNFDEIIDRRNQGSLKWDVKEGDLPMWVADMDFRTCPAIIESIVKRASQGTMGYSIYTDAWYEAYQNWWKRRHGFDIDREWMIFSTGVIPIISSVVRKLTTVGENVLVISPVYGIFYNSIFNNGRNIVECVLDYDADTAVYTLDMDKLEDYMKNPQTTMLLLCNPHNPTGIIWDKETLRKIGELSVKYNVVVVSDEIHCDLTIPGREYVPYASVSDECKENSVICIAPTKAFNIAGVQTAAAVVPNPVLRHKVWRGLNTDEVAEGNVFSEVAAVAAFNEGEAWLSELRTYLYDNRKFAETYISENIPDIKVIKGEATYLMWVDVRNVCDDSDDFSEFLKSSVGLHLSEGSEFRGDGKHFLRINLACPRSVLLDGMQRLTKGTANYLGR